MKKEIELDIAVLINDLRKNEIINLSLIENVLMEKNKIKDKYKHYEELKNLDSFKYSDSEQCYYAAKYTDAEFFLKSDKMTVDFPFRASRQLFGETILDSDDEGNILIRKHLSPFFSKKAIEKYRETIIRPCIKSIINKGVEANNKNIDFNFSISQRIPMQIILCIFGIDLKYERYLYSSLEKLVLYLDHPSNSFQEAMDAKGELLSFLEKCVVNEIEVREDGLLSLIDEKHYKDKDEMLRTCLMLLVAGMATTIASLNSLIVYIYEYINYLKDNLKNIDKLTKFVNEIIRLHPAVWETVRFVKEDFDHKNISFQENDMVKIILASANRDEQKFKKPHDFDPNEKRSLNCSFGKGKHHCIGADLAIEELVVFIQEFLPFVDRFNVRVLKNDRPEGTVIKMFKKIQLYLVD